MRNIFHQYQQPENQLSHALATVLSIEVKFCRRFVKWLTGDALLTQATLLVEQQRIPGIAIREADLEDGEGLPDLCIHAGGDWCLAIEVKVCASLTSGQLRRHQKSVERYFDKVFVAVITAESSPKQLPAGIPHKTWEDVYVWCGQRAGGTRWVVGPTSSGFHAAIRVETCGRRASSSSITYHVRRHSIQ